MFLLLQCNIRLVTAALSQNLKFLQRYFYPLSFSLFSSWSLLLGPIYVSLLVTVTFISLHLLHPLFLPHLIPLSLSISSSLFSLSLLLALPKFCSLWSTSYIPIINYSIIEHPIFINLQSEGPMNKSTG